jgi:hypothetical protein
MGAIVRNQICCLLTLLLLLRFSQSA